MISFFPFVLHDRISSFFPISLYHDSFISLFRYVWGKELVDVMNDDTDGWVGYGGS